MAVFVIDRFGQSLMPCTEKRARLLLQRGRARVKRIKPFVIILLDRTAEDCQFQPLEVKLDPGSKVTGICISRTINQAVNVVALYELTHRGEAIKANMTDRRMYRRNRRNRKTRYRQPRFLNRTRAPGWLAPSLQHRVDSTMSWIYRFMRWAPITMLAVERIKFDMQRMENAEISGIAYQRGTLYHYEVMEYLLEKYHRSCVYCGTKKAFFERDHVTPRSQGGSNRISNLVLSCRPCNRAKGAQSLEQFLIHHPAKLAAIKKQLKTPLHDAAAVNTTRNALFEALLQTGLPVETGSGAQTKQNRQLYNVPKSHSLDAACVGEIKGISGYTDYVTLISCKGRGCYQRAILNRFGTPRDHRPKSKHVFGFQTGDLARVASRYVNAPPYRCVRIMIRSDGRFRFNYNKATNETPWHRCKKLQRNDGYEYGHEVRSTVVIDGKPELFLLPR